MTWDLASLELDAITPIGPDRTVEQTLVRELRSLIIDGKFPAGAHLRYRDLASRFNVSVTPVRIALRELAKEGLVDIRPQGGVQVAELSLEELEEIYATRMGIESWLAQLGAAALTDSDVETLDAHFTEAERCVAAGDRHGFLQAAWLCRLVVYRAADRPRMFDHVNLLFRRSARYNEMALSREEGFERSLLVTRELRDACLRRDGAEARRAIRALLDRSLEHLVEQLPDLREHTTAD